MAYEYRHFDATIPAGTAKAAPVTIQLAMPSRVVRRVRVRFPPGPSGLVGVQLGSSGVQVIPWNAGSFLIGDDEAFTFEPDGFITTGAWQLIGYNTGAWPHTLPIDFELDPPQVGASSGPVGFIDGSGLDSTGGGGITPLPLPEPPPEPAPPPAPAPPPPVVDGYAVAKANAIAAVETAFGAPVDVTPSPAPDPSDPAAAAYDAGKQAAVAALAALQPS